MWLTLFQLLLVASGVQASCWYDSLCPYCDEDDEIVIPDVENTNDLKFGWCQDQCLAKEPSGSCKHFTVQTDTSTSTTYCYLLDTCTVGEMESCLTDTENPCNSGPVTCEDDNGSCDILTAYDGKISWQCDGTNPYTHKVPDGRTCFLTCPAWVDNAGQMVMITSTCSGGVYQPSEITSPTSALRTLPSDLPQPDGDEDSQLSCECEDKDMAWPVDGNGGVNYDPNKMPGTDFICTGGSYINTVNTDGTGYDFFRLTPAMTCRLFCDSYYITTMACKKGAWTGRPELGAWCYKEPTPEDNMNTPGNV